MGFLSRRRRKKAPAAATVGSGSMRHESRSLSGRLDEVPTGAPLEQELRQDSVEEVGKLRLMDKEERRVVALAAETAAINELIKKAANNRSKQQLIERRKSQKERDMRPVVEPSSELANKQAMRQAQLAAEAEALNAAIRKVATEANSPPAPEGSKSRSNSKEIPALLRRSLSAGAGVIEHLEHAQEVEDGGCREEAAQTRSHGGGGPHHASHHRSPREDDPPAPAAGRSNVASPPARSRPPAGVRLRVPPPGGGAWAQGELRGRAGSETMRHPELEGRSASTETRRPLRTSRAASERRRPEVLITAVPHTSSSALSLPAVTPEAEAAQAAYGGPSRAHLLLNPR